ncbi:putative carotene-dioxygenase [Endogone sp. FLAS-F59071]|nr:putative carotene-dioxygenase [Endogone sp. FLAS-F59071]|eukprot:RUS21095.1 putative carotene-dioxygenase [Endogone sp. FLAS-F59071]
MSAGERTLNNCPETVEPIDLTVHGKLPEWLDGVLYKAGQGVFSITLSDGQTHKISHPFDGLSQVHRFEFLGASNTVRYNSRYTARGYEKRIERRDDTMIMFGRDPCQTTLGQLQSFYHRLLSNHEAKRKMHEEDPSSENINVTVTPNFPLPKEMTDDKLVVVVKTDANILQLIDAETLEPKKLLNYTDIDPNLVGRVSAAHHQTDTSTSEYFNFVMHLGKEITLSAFSLDASGKSHPFESIRHPAGREGQNILPSYIHAFSLTDRYVVLPNYPYYYAWNGLSLIWSGSLTDAFRWDPSRPTLFHVLDRQTRKHVATYEGDAFFAFHTLNAWDEGEDVVFDTCAYEDASVIINNTQNFGTTGKAKKKNGGKPANVRRYRLKDVKGVAARQLAGSKNKNVELSRAEYEVRAVGLELARMHPAYERKPYRYAYGTATDGTNGILKKVDLNGGERNAEWLEEGLSPSEPIFIPTQYGKEGADEDDGVVLSIVNDAHAGKRCFLLVLDAHTFKELARAEVGQFSPVTLHGSFINGHGKNVSIN